MIRSAITACAAALALAAPAVAAPAATLTGRAVLPAETFAPGPTSGRALVGPVNGVLPPFADRQPVQGLSGALDRGDGTFTFMPDNGYGAKENSADFDLRMYTARPRLHTAAGGPGTLDLLGFVELTDPRERIPFPIVNEGSLVRTLTGADFDIESIQRVRDGTYWIGDEFGPFLLHVDVNGRLLHAPVPTPGVVSPQNPFLGAYGVPNLPRSKGFEGMALSTDGHHLYPMLEGTVAGDPPDTLRILQFDLQTARYTGRMWRFPLAAPGHALGDLQAIDDHELLLIERDEGQGAAATYKRLVRVNLSQVDPATGTVARSDVADLLAIADPAGISTAAPDPRPGDIGLGDPFAFPFQTIEDVVILGPRRLLVVNDNNFPFSLGRNPVLPDHTEAITLRLADPLPIDRSVTILPGLGTAREGLSRAISRIVDGDREDAADAIAGAVALIREGRLDLLDGGASPHLLDRARLAERLARRGLRALEAGHEHRALVLLTVGRRVLGKAIARL